MRWSAHAEACSAMQAAIWMSDSTKLSKAAEIDVAGSMEIAAAASIRDLLCQLRSTDPEHHVALINELVTRCREASECSEEIESLSIAVEEIAAQLQYGSTEDCKFAAARAIIDLSLRSPQFQIWFSACTGVLAALAELAVSRDEQGR